VGVYGQQEQEHEQRQEQEQLYHSNILQTVEAVGVDTGSVWGADGIANA
jgi:hypothetical protein